MVLRLLCLFFALFLFAADAEAKGSVYVKGHYRKNGTYVAPYYRNAPGMGSSANQYSSPSNYLPTIDSESAAQIQAGSDFNLIPAQGTTATSPSRIQRGFERSLPSQPPITNIDSTSSTEERTISVTGQEDKVVLEIMNADAATNPTLSQFLGALKSSIQRAWHPEPVQTFSKCLISFEINKLGQAEKLRITGTSGNGIFDENVAKAVLDGTKGCTGEISSNLSIIALFKSCKRD